MRAQRPLRVLVVDDVHDTALTLATLLRTLGHEAEFTTNPHEALALATELNPDVAFLDIGMPGLTGYQLAGLLRKSFGRALCLVAISGYADAEYRKRGREAGFDAYLSKPAEVELIEATLNQLLRGR